jgi:hypothetical protein
MLAGRSAIHLRTMTSTPTARRERSYSPTGTIGRRLARAHELQLQIQKLEAELSRHRELLLEHMSTKELDRIQLAGFKATKKVRHNWSYSAYVEAFSLRLRQMQQDEQIKGIAFDRPTTYVSLSTGR